MVIVLLEYIDLFLRLAVLQVRIFSILKIIIPIMLALCLMLSGTYYAKNYAGIIGRGLTRAVLIYWVSLVVDSSDNGAFGELLCMPTFNKHVATNNKNKQVPILRKQVYRSLIKIISLALLLLLKH